MLLDKRHTIEPLALVYLRDDAAFEREVDAEVAQLHGSGLVRLYYRRGFEQLVLPQNVNLQRPPGRLTKEIFRAPLKMRAGVDIIVL